MKKIRTIIQWYKRRKGQPIVDYRKGCGYYITVGLLGYNPIGKTEEWKMESGKTMIVKLLDYERFSDPWDMIKESEWQYIGFKGEKPFAELTLREYLKIFY